jgi:hypothetical protein
MKVTGILCDYAVVADGKLYISGGGWNVTGPEPSQSAIALLFEVPWDRTNTAPQSRTGLPLSVGHQGGRRHPRPDKAAVHDPANGYHQS